MVSILGLSQKPSGKKKGIRPKDVVKEKKLEKIAHEKARQKELKHRFKIQDKATQKRIKASRKEINKNNRKERGLFFQNWFKKKPKGKVRKKKHHKKNKNKLR